MSSFPESGFDLDRNHLPIASLDGLWRFHLGDDPSYSSPDLDDSKWVLIRSDQTWAEQHLAFRSGSFWYRTKVTVPAGSESLSVYLPALDVNYEMFCDGRLLGGNGGMPPHPHVNQGRVRSFVLCTGEASALNGPRIITLAIRGWRWRADDPLTVDGLRPGIRLGATPLIEQLVTLRTRTVFWRISSNLFLTIFEVLACVAAFALFLLRPKETEYLWFGLLSLLYAVTRCHLIWSSSQPFQWPTFVLVRDLLGDASTLALMLFLLRLLSGRRDWLFLVSVVAIGIDCVLSVADMVPWMISPDWLLADTALFNALHAVLFLPSILWIVVLSTRRAIEGRDDGRLLLPGIVFVALGNPFELLLVSLAAFFGWSDASQAWYFRTSQWPMPFSMENISDAVLLVTMLAVLVRRFTRTRLHEDLFEREREAARTVQQVLIPDVAASVPGFVVTSVYKPFGEVGGDFFQVLPSHGVHSASALVVIGDVSGKGLPAAMTVSLLVGTFRTLARYTQEPAEILAGLNAEMSGRSNGGFTTCLVLRADPDGTLVAANAGHICPYCDGEEILVAPGLPLGLDTSAEYTQSIFKIGEHTGVTLLTDGVVEARAKTGELFGFERTRAISQESAEAIAQRAQVFGQDDDITVLKLRLLTRDDGARMPPEFIAQR